MKVIQHVYPLDPEYRGSTYIFSYKGNPEVLRVGATSSTVEHRFQSWTHFCGPVYDYDRELYAETEMAVLFPYHVQELIFTELKNYRMCLENCEGCHQDHMAFLNVSKVHAPTVFQKWKQWMLKSPYTNYDDGEWKLKSSFLSQAREMCRPLAMNG